VSGRGAIAASAALALGAVGCGGGVPLLHGAHVLRPGNTMFGAGATARVAVIDPAEEADAPSRILEDLGFGAGVAPVVVGRVGIEGQNEAGLTYAGRTIRLDGRHAFDLGNDWAMSLGLGGSALLPRRDAAGRDDAATAYGPGVDVPLLFGTHAGAGIYTVWIGPRVGFEHLRGSVDATIVDDPATGGPAPDGTSLDLEGNHFWAGGLVGVRVGFRHVHVALEVDAAWHHGTGSIGSLRGSFDQVSIAPAGALLLEF